MKTGKSTSRLAKQETPEWCLQVPFNGWKDLNPSRFPISLPKPSAHHPQHLLSSLKATRAPPFVFSCHQAAYKASNWSPRPQLETTSINQVIQGPRVIVEAPSFSCGLKASIQKGRMAERSIKLVRPRISLVQMHCYLAPKKNSQKCPYKGQNMFEPKTHISKSFSNTFTETCSFLSWIKVGQPHQKYVLWWSSPIRQASAHQ